MPQQNKAWHALKQSMLDKFINTYSNNAQAVERWITLQASDQSAGVIERLKKLKNDKRFDITNPNVVRSSLGTLFSVPIAVSTNEKAIEFLKQRNIQIVASIPGKKSSYSHADYKGACAVVLGSEKEGISSFWVGHAEKKVSIPMQGKADSLNVSATAAVLIYEAFRQRNQ